jgi:hypothetical protein
VNAAPAAPAGCGVQRARHCLIAIEQVRGLSFIINKVLLEEQFDVTLRDCFPRLQVPNPSVHAC